MGHFANNRNIYEIKQDWQINLLCQKALESAQMPLLPSDGIRRVISTLAGGVLLPGGLGIKDPCEKDNADAFASLSLQGNGLITLCDLNRIQIGTIPNRFHKLDT